MFLTSSVFQILIRNSSNPSHQILFTSIRQNHRLFSKTFHRQQVRLMEKFDREIEDTMERIRTNQKLKVKRKRKVLSDTTNILMDQDSKSTFQAAPNPAGFPEQIMIRKDRLSHAFLSTRMRILNKNFLIAIADIFQTDEQFSKKSEEFDFRITDVRVSADYQLLQVYWSVKDQANKDLCASYLTSQKGRLHELLTEMHFTSGIPWISFVYDLQSYYEQEIQSKLDECQNDLTTKTIENQQPITDSTEYELIDRINFDGRLNIEVPDEEEDLKKLRYKAASHHQQQKFDLPNDTSLKNFYPDHEILYNKVLQKMHRTRAQHSEDLMNMKSLEDFSIQCPQKPAPNFAENPINYNTEERIKAIKKFVITSRKRNNKLERKIKRMLLCEEINRFDDYEQLREQVEQRYTKLFEDKINQSNESEYN